LAPYALLGVHVDKFEREWRDRLRQTNSQGNLGEAPPFCIQSLNVMARPWSAYSPSEQHIAAVRDWLDRTFDYAKGRLPTSLTSLVAAIEANRIADHDVEAYLGHPLKVRGFIEWLHCVHGVDIGARIHPLLSDRTDPYDAAVMMAPWPRL
jgi:hypothetical protein